MNDWKIRKCLIVVLSLQVAVFGISALESIGLTIFGVREAFGLIYLTFVPGILILRILKIHRLSSGETFLITVGTSIVSWTIIGLFMNTIYPLIGITRPISKILLTVTMGTITLILSILSYLRDKSFSGT
jgi:uncharacterized membrane protein